MKNNVENNFINIHMIRTGVNINRQDVEALKKAGRSSLDAVVSKYRCRYCPKLLPSLLDLRRHYRTVHKEEHSLRKAQRPKGNNRNYAKLTEKNKSAVKKKFKGINHSVNNSAKKVKRMSDDSLKRTYRCSFCPESFPSLVGVRLHTQDEHKEESDLRKELKANNDNSKIWTVTEKRNSTVKDRHDSAKKARLSVDATEFPCNFCEEIFPSLSAVKDHIRNEHKKENDKEPRPNQDNSNIEVTKDSNSNSGTILMQNQSKQIPLYQCSTCKYTSISYDHMIEHCQDHIIEAEDSEDANTQEPISPRKCEPSLMELDVDDDTYNVLENNLNINSYTFIDCDYTLLKTDNWPANYEKLTKSEIDAIKCSSIYYFTRIIRFTSPKKVSSAPYMLFECQKCMKYVDPYSIVSHVENSSCNEQLKGYPCYVCKLPFLTETSMYLHYKTHQVANAEMKYRIIKFNNNDEENAVLLKAAGHNMKCSSSGEKGGVQNVVQQKTNVVQPDVGDKNCGQTKDARTMIIPGAKVTKNTSKESCEIANNITKEEKSVTVYKCQCELSFHSLNELFEHIGGCPSDVIINKTTCICSLVFDERQYNSHYKIHSQGITKFIVKKVTVSDECVIALDMQHSFREYAEERENVVMRVTNNDALNTDKAKNIATNVVKANQEKSPEKLATDQKEAISGLISSIMNLPNMLANTGDLKTVEKKRRSCVAANKKADDSTVETVVKCSGLPMTVPQLGQEANEEVKRTRQEVPSVNLISQSERDIIISLRTVATEKQYIDVSKATELVIDTTKVTNNQNKSLHPESENTEKNHLLLNRTAEEELTNKDIIGNPIEGDLSNASSCISELEKTNLINMADPNGNDRILKKNSNKEITLNITKDQLNESINTESNKNSEYKETTRVLTNDNPTNVECNEEKEAAENKLYTEEELLNETDEDDDPILLYDHADEELNKDSAVA